MAAEWFWLANFANFQSVDDGWLTLVRRQDTCQLMIPLLRKGLSKLEPIFSSKGNITYPVSDVIESFQYGEIYRFLSSQGVGQIRRNGISSTWGCKDARRMKGVGKENRSSLVGVQNDDWIGQYIICRSERKSTEEDDKWLLNFDFFSTNGSILSEGHLH